ncbi:MAG: hypothetical protein EOO73_09350 [Myxococcales bacterium]|nr:MAG: hypothetical protein EOO73_09350 [Myxococcales bacterium]
MKNWGLIHAGAALLFGGACWGCSSDCEDEIAAAQAFLSSEANLACESDADCVVVSTGCHTFEGGVCSQAYLSRRAANGTQWASITADLEECEGDCTVCDAALAPAQCVSGRCAAPD